MKKRILCLIISVLLFTGTVFANAAIIPADVYDTEFENDVAILSELGIVEVGEEGLFMPYQRVTRAELAVILKKLIRPENITGSSKYLDVADTHYAMDAINYISEQGYMSGYGNGIFKPDEEIKYLEMVKVAVSLLGYDKLAEADGGYPKGYLKIAGNIGILSGVNAENEYINKGNIAKLLVNLFDAHPVKMDFKGSTPAYIVDESVTMLNVLCGIYKEKGIVSANEDYSLSGIDTSSKDTIRINSYEFIYNKAEDYVGYNVECYYSINDDDEYVTEAIIPIERKNKVIKIKAEEIESCENYLIEYLDGSDKVKKASYDNNTVFIYNSKNMNSFKTEDLDFDNGYIEWIDNDSDNVADTVKIFEYYNMVVEYANSEKLIDKFDNTKLINAEDYKSIEIYDVSGDKKAMSDIASGTVASVYKSNTGNDDIIKIILSEKTVEGVVEQVYSKDGSNYIVIGDTTYVLYSGYRTYQGTTVGLKDAGIFLADAEGKIVTFTKSLADDFKLGILVRCKNYEDEETGEEIIDLRLYTQGGSLVDVKAREKLRLDAEVYKTAAFSEACDIIKSVVQEPIRYKLNADGYVTVVDTSKPGKGGINDKLTKGPEITTGSRYLAATGILEGRMVLDADLVAFLIPSSFENVIESDFGISGIGYFVGNSSYNGVKSYYLEDKIPVDIVVLQAATSIINNKSNVALVKSVHNVVNEDDEAVISLEVYVNGNNETWMAENNDTFKSVYKINNYSRSGDTLEILTSQKIEQGDLIKCSFDSHGAINKIAVIYDESAERMLSVNPYHTDFHEMGERYVMGNINNKYEGYAEITYTNTSGAQAIEYHNLAKGKVYRINTKNREIMEEISLAELSDAVHNLKAEQVITISEAGVPKVTYIYE